MSPVSCLSPWVRQNFPAPIKNRAKSVPQVRKILPVLSLRIRFSNFTVVPLKSRRKTIVKFVFVSVGIQVLFLGIPFLAQTFNITVGLK